MFSSWIRRIHHFASETRHLLAIRWVERVKVLFTIGYTTAMTPEQEIVLGHEILGSVVASPFMPYAAEPSPQQRATLIGICPNPRQPLDKPGHGLGEAGSGSHKRIRVPSRIPDMDLTEVDIERLREVCVRYGVASLEVFGSVARGEDGPDSDVDLLYVLKPGVRLGFDLFGLEDDLAEVFGRKVDLVSRRAINKYLREQVLADARELYAA